MRAGKLLGDAVADLTHATGLDKLTETYTRVTGRDCGCEGRRQFLNAISPEVFGRVDI